MWAYTFPDALALFPFFDSSWTGRFWWNMNGLAFARNIGKSWYWFPIFVEVPYIQNRLWIGSYSNGRKHLSWLECGAHGSMRVDGLDRHMCGQDPWWQATNASDLGTVNRLKLSCGYFHLNRSTNHQIISNQIALLFAEEHREASLVWLLLAPHSFRLVKVATALSVTKTKRPNSTKKSLALCF